jgi:Uma2 family endonuclease
MMDMSAVLQHGMSLAEFLTWEEKQELRYEFDGFRPVAMTDGTLVHETICGTLRALLYQRLRGKPCRAWGPTTKIEVQGRIRYPDAHVNCTPFAPDATIVPEPVVVFEVLSPGTSRTDRIEKLREYQATASIARYVILEQDSIAATVFSRMGAEWIARALTDGDTLQMPEIGIELALSEIYSDVSFDDPVGADTASSPT